MEFKIETVQIDTGREFTNSMEEVNVIWNEIKGSKNKI